MSESEIIYGFPRKIFGDNLIIGAILSFISFLLPIITFYTLGQRITPLTKKLFIVYIIIFILDIYNNIDFFTNIDDKKEERDEFKISTSNSNRIQKYILLSILSFITSIIISFIYAKE